MAIDDDVGYAVLRIDSYKHADVDRIKVVRVFWAAADAEAEVARLMKLNADKGCTYLWQHTRIKRRTKFAE